ncbi:unnamed protein product [Gordionus sp. m RMFG-2023]
MLLFLLTSKFPLFDVPLVHPVKLYPFALFRIPYIIPLSRWLFYIFSYTPPLFLAPTTFILIAPFPIEHKFVVLIGLTFFVPSLYLNKIGDETRTSTSKITHFAMGHYIIFRVE